MLLFKNLIYFVNISWCYDNPPHLYSVEEVGFARSISADNDIVARIKRFHNCLFSVRLKALYDDLLDVHCQVFGADIKMEPALDWHFSERILGWYWGDKRQQIRVDRKALESKGFMRFSIKLPWIDFLQKINFMRLLYLLYSVVMMSRSKTRSPKSCLFVRIKFAERNLWKKK